MYNIDGMVVTNTYPVFKKAMIDNENGLCLSKDLSKVKKNNYTNFKKYMDEFNTALNNFVCDCYDNAYPQEQFVDDLIIPGVNTRYYEIDNEYFLYTIKTDLYFILLNYGQFRDVEHVRKIPSVSNYDIHVKKLKQMGNDYEVTNTYNSFLNFTFYNDIYQNLDANDPFYECFFHSIENVDLSLHIGNERRANDVNYLSGKYRYSYFVYVVVKGVKENVIIIVDYYPSNFRFKND